MSGNPITVGKAEIQGRLGQSDRRGAVRGRRGPARAGGGHGQRSPHHHARIVQIDAGAARALPGVIAVITAADVPGSKTFGPLVQDRPALAVDVVRHMGEPVAIVVAESKTAARRGVGAVAVEYEPLPAVFDPTAALKPGAPRVHPGGNVVTRYDVAGGDVEAGFAGADIVLEHVFEVPRIAPGYMEPEASTAEWGADGTLTVWVSSQKPFEDRHQIADVLGLPQDAIRVKSAVIGGAFGGKEDSGLAILAALAAWVVKGTVRLVNNRHESFLAHPKRHPARLFYKLGAKRDGTLVALQATVHMDTGAYAEPAVSSGTARVVRPGGRRPPDRNGARRVPHPARARRDAGGLHQQPLLRRDARLRQPAGALRHREPDRHAGERAGHGPARGAPQEHPPAGDRFSPGSRSTTRRAACPPSSITPRWRAPGCPRSRAAGQGGRVGCALALQSMGLGYRVPDDLTNRLEWAPDGTVRVCGRAGPAGAAAAAEQIAAEALGIPYADAGAGRDTAISPNGGVARLRMTYVIGNSVVLAPAS